MEFIRGLYNLKSHHYGCVATIGNFDGLHLGHQQVLQQLYNSAQQFQLPALLITFEPLAPEFFAHGVMPARLMRLREKLQQLREGPLARLLVIKFNAAFASLTAADFVKIILVKKLGLRHLIVGDDFRFGNKREGDFALLARLGRELQFSVTNTPSILWADERVGSSRVRQALARGELALAQQLLGKPYTMSGHVVHGDKRGRLLGFPTANLLLHRAVTPVSGVFAVKVRGLKQRPLFGVANVGRRPTLDGQKQLLEVHVLDFNAEIYGKLLQIEFIHKIRAEQRFASVELLQRQIQLDVVIAKDLFAAR